MIPRYTRPEMGAVWSEQRKLDAWLQVVYLPKTEEAKTGNRLQLPGPWGNTVKGLRCRITELALAE